MLFVCPFWIYADLPNDFSDGNIFTADEANTWKDEREGSLLPISSSSLEYEDATHDLGSSSYQWRDLHISRDVIIGDDLFVTDNATVTGNLTVNGSMTGNSDVSVGNDLSISNDLFVTNNATVTGNLTVNGTLNANSNAVIDGNMAVDTNTLFANSASNRVGIGTNGPAKKLSVQVSGSSDGIFLSDSSNNLVVLSKENLGGRLIVYDSGSSVAQIGGGNSKDTYFDNGGNVGIGTGTPGKSLAIHTGSTNDGMGIYNGSDNLRSLISISSGDDAELALYDSSDSETVHIDTDGDTYFNGGDIGIGTSSPGTFFELRGADSTILSDQINTISAMSDLQSIRLRNTSETQGSFVAYEGMVENNLGQTQNGFLAFESTNDTRRPRISIGQRSGGAEQEIVLTIDSDADVGIGTTDPSTLLHINNDTHGDNTTITLTAENGSGTEKTGSIIMDPDNDRIEMTGTNVDSLSVDTTLDVSGNADMDANVSVAGNVSVSGNVVSDGGYDSGDGTALKFSKINIGTWNMNSSGSISVSIPFSYTNIYSFEAVIFNDAQDDMKQLSGEYNGGNPDGEIGVDLTNDEFDLARSGSDTFDNSSYDSTGINRGYIYVVYD